MNDTHPSGGKELPAGTRLEEFVIERVLGSGGFGITYLARDTSLNRQVVIKENLPSQFAHRDTTSLTIRPGPGREDQENFQWSLENFSREAEMLASLHHPGIVPVLRRFETFGTAYFVMPFVEGVPFDFLIEDRHRKNNPFSEDELRGLLERVLSALDHLHQRGIYHRDIKPANILISNDGIPVLIDFGSARQWLSERSMTVVESAGYTPFEQLESRGNVGPWSDLYALGGTLEKALTGQTPPKAMDRMRRDPRVPLVNRPELCASYSSVLLSSIDKALEVEEADRWKDAGKWLEGFREQGAAHSKTHRPAALKSTPTKAVSWMPDDLKQEAPMASVTQMSQAADTATKSNRALWLVAACLVLGLFALAKAISGNKNENLPDAMGDDSSLQQERIYKARLLELAESGDAYAQALVGFNLLFVPVEGLSDDERVKRESESLKWLEKSSAQGHPLGLAVRGSAERLLKQRDEAVNAESYAKKCYEAAVRAGLLENLEQQGAVWSCFAAVAYDMGRGVEKNPMIAVKWHRMAADQGVALSQFYLGTHYHSGEGVAKNEAEAVKWFRKAADAGFAPAIGILGISYYNGIGVAKNEAEAVKWFRKAAEAGNVPSMTELGTCYANGTGVAKDEAQSVKWFRKAADAGEARAMNNLGVCYDHGTGVAKDEAEAVKWYLKAADAGDEEVAEQARVRLKELRK